MQLAFSINGNPVPVPSSIASLTARPADFGFFYLGFFLNIFYVVGIGVALGYILYGGWRWITSSGDPKEIKNARETIVYALVGLTVIFCAMLLVNFVSKFFGINLLGGPN